MVVEGMVDEEKATETQLDPTLQDASTLSQEEISQLLLAELQDLSDEFLN